jgi:carbon monoxide dehydrogenase subunit G
MDLTNSFDIPGSVDETFALLLDVDRIVPCVPGAELVAVVDPHTYQCKVTLKLGPLTLTFRGTVKFVEIDADAKTARMTLHGADEKGRGNADAVVRFALSGDGEGTHVDVLTTLTLTGMVAQYGRAGGIIAGVAGELTRRFAANLRAELLKGAPR